MRSLSTKNLHSASLLMPQSHMRGRAAACRCILQVQMRRKLSATLDYHEIHNVPDMLPACR